jgi:hypothetical protein
VSNEERLTTYNPFLTAMRIIDPGACNGVAIAASLHTLMLQLMHETRNTNRVNKHPAVQLIIHQLGHLAGGDLLNQAQFEDAYKVCKACSDEDLQMGIPKQKFRPVPGNVVLPSLDEVILLDTLTDSEFDVYALTCQMHLRKFDVTVGSIRIYEGANSFWIINCDSKAEPSDVGASIRPMGDLSAEYSDEGLGILVGTAEFYVTLMNHLKTDSDALHEAYFGIKERHCTKCGTDILPDVTPYYIEPETPLCHVCYDEGMTELSKGK